MEETVTRLRAIPVLVLLLTAGALVTACKTTDGGAPDSFRSIDSRHDP
jgi:predicted small secreted protein